MIRVGLIDDDQALLEAFRVILKDEGFEVAAYRDGQQAVKEFTVHPPAIVFIDVMLAGKMSGTEIAATLRREKKTAALPIVLMSGLEDISEIARSLDVDYVMKPSSIEHIIGKITEHAPAS